jgi:hypothetical protein
MESIIDDVIQYIVTFLPPQSLYSMLLVSKHYNTLIDNEIQWKQYLNSHYSNSQSTLIDCTLSSKNKYKQLLTLCWCTHYTINQQLYVNSEQQYFSLSNNGTSISTKRDSENSGCIMSDYHFIHVKANIPSSGITKISFAMKTEKPDYLSIHFLLFGIVQESILIEQSKRPMTTYIGVYSDKAVNIGYANNGYIIDRCTPKCVGHSQFDQNNIVTVCIDAEYNKSSTDRYGMCHFMRDSECVGTELTEIFEPLQSNQQKLYFCLSIEMNCPDIQVSIIDYVHTSVD